MPASDEYSKLAEECFRLAREAKDETDRLACLDLAQKWLEAASDQNERASEQVAQEQKPESAGTPKSETSQGTAPSGWLQRALGIFRRDRLQH
jgi:hypothetical protein